MASISKQSKEQQERNRRILMAELKKPENKECADCRTRNPTWASINLGIYVCIRCSGLHRQIGVHISKVRSCTMDLWEPEQMSFILKMGNANAKRIWEHQLPPDYGKPSENEDDQLVMQWIRTKYEKKKFMHPNPEAVLMQINQEAKEAANAGSGGAKKTTGATLTRKTTTASSTSAVQQSDAVSVAPVSSPAAAAVVVATTTAEAPAQQIGWDSSLPTSFGSGGGGGFNFGGGDQQQPQQQSGFAFASAAAVQPPAEAGAGAADIMEQLRKQQEALMSQIAAAQQQQPPAVVVAADKLPGSFNAVASPSGGFNFAAAAAGASSFSDQQQQVGSGGGGFAFAQGASDGNSGFSFVANDKSATSPLSAPLPKADEVVDALFSDKPLRAVLDFTRFVSPASPLDMHLVVNNAGGSGGGAGFAGAVPMSAVKKKQPEFDPFSVLANLGLLSKVQPTAAADPAEHFFPSSSPSTTQNVLPASGDDLASSRKNANNGSGNSNNNSPLARGEEQPAAAGFGFGFAETTTASSNQEGGGGGGGFGFGDGASGAGGDLNFAGTTQDASAGGGGFGFADPATTATGDSSNGGGDQANESVIEQLRLQQEVLMRQMASLMQKSSGN